MKEKVALIDGRFELLNSPERIEVYDIRNLDRGGDGSVTPVAVILEAPITDRNAGKMALAWLRKAEYLTVSEHLRNADIFVAQCPVQEKSEERVLRHPAIREK